MVLPTSVNVIMAETGMPWRTAARAAICSIRRSMKVCRKMWSGFSAAPAEICWSNSS